MGSPKTRSSSESVDGNQAKKRKLSSSDSPGSPSCTSISNSSSGNSAPSDEKSLLPSKATDSSSSIAAESHDSSNDNPTSTSQVVSVSAGEAAAAAQISSSVERSGNDTSSSVSNSMPSNPSLKATTSGESVSIDSGTSTTADTSNNSNSTPDNISENDEKKKPLEKKPTPPPPLKSTTMSHLRKKYMAQLEYMDREFKRLERQLLGARTRNGQEAAGSRERREKLHSFILHLEDTMRQIELGCKLETDGKSTLGVAFSSMEGTASGVNDDSNDHSEATQGVKSQLNEEDEEAKEEFARSSALTKLTKEKEEEENVQRLEEHILANLLPVKDRLTRQLAAQEGAAKNPAGMPINRGGLKPSSVERGKGTFAAAAEQRRLRIQQQQKDDSSSASPLKGPLAHSQFGKPLVGGGSSLTQKLHGVTLGSHDRSHGHGVGSNNIKSNSGTPVDKRKVVYAGMTPGSSQVKSGVSAAAGVHDIEINNPKLKDYSNTITSSEKTKIHPPPPPPQPTATTTLGASIQKTSVNNQLKTKLHKPTTIQPPSISTNANKSTQANINANLVTKMSSHQTLASKYVKVSVPPPPPGLEMTVVPKAKKSLNDPSLTEEERQEIRDRRRLRKEEKRKEEKRKLLMVQQQRQQEQQQLKEQQVSCSVRRSVSTRPVTQRKGPRSVEYICSLCNETYKTTCDYNPWWSLISHECVKCGKVQIPRLDISSPENAIEYHPALLAHANEDSSKSQKNNTNTSLSRINIKGYMSSHTVFKDSSLDDNFIASDDDFYSTDSDTSITDDMSPSTQAENEDFGRDYSGPKFTDYDASRLLIMIEHASTCPGRHKTAEARNICNGIKFMMLHVRDCPGTTSTFDICPFPWCRKTKHLLYHLVSCLHPEKCAICACDHLTPQLKQLKGLNSYRRKKQKVKAKESSAVSVANTKSTGKVNASTNTANQGLRKKSVSSGVNNTIVNGKINNGRSALSVSKETSFSKVSVPSPIPPVATNQAKITKPKHPGERLNLSILKTGRSNYPALSTKGHLTITAPANPLLSSQNNTTPIIRNPIKSSIPIPPAANPLSTPNPHSAVDMLSNKNNTLSNSIAQSSKSIDTIIESRATENHHKASDSVSQNTITNQEKSNTVKIDDPQVTASSGIKTS